MLIIDSSTLDERGSGLSPSELYWVYNGLDCCITMEVFEKTHKMLDSVSSKTYQVGMETQAPVLEMVLEGMPISYERIAAVRKHYQDTFDELERKFFRLCVEGLGIPADRTKRKGRPPCPINIASPKDVQYLFHEVLGIPYKKVRKKGSDTASVTTNRDALESFTDYFYAEPFVNLILAQRDALKSIGFLKTKPDPDHRFRCSFNVAGTKTGRLSSSFSDEGTGTNLQNVAGKLKDIFVAPEGWCFVDVDLEQGDSRGVGAIAWNMFVESHGEEFAGKYLDACESGDLHTTVCRMAWTNLDWGEDPKLWKPVAQQIAYRDKSYRDLAKVMGHGTNYMGQPVTMAKNTKLPVNLVVDFQKSYLTAFGCVKAWQEETIRLLQTERALTSPWGRRRYFWKDPKAQTTINDAIAYSPQNTTGEFTNRGMIQLWRYRNAKNLPIRFLLQVHDSLVFLVRQEALEDMIPLMLDKLRVYLELARGRQFTIPHGCKVGWNYGSYDKDKNPYGLTSWKGKLDRDPPPRFTDNLNAILNLTAKDLR